MPDSGAESSSRKRIRAGSELPVIGGPHDGASYRVHRRGVLTETEIELPAGEGTIPGSSTPRSNGVLAIYTLVLNAGRPVARFNRYEPTSSG